MSKKTEAETRTETSAKTMQRSRNQLATSYAPESFFTFEGGMGACIARSVAGEPLELSAPTRQQIYERIEELAKAWFDMAKAARANAPDKLQPEPAQCVGPYLLDPSRRHVEVPGWGRLLFTKPTQMGYTPAPLAFVCRACGKFQDFEKLADLDTALEGFMRTEKCLRAAATGPCDWEQLDVVFVHWSGKWVAPFPGQWQWDRKNARVYRKRSSCDCGSTRFTLNRRSPSIGDWFFECASSTCRRRLSEKWLQNDPETLRILHTAGHDPLPTEFRMEVTPYRASNAYYVKSDLFIDFKDSGLDLLGRLRPERRAELCEFIARHYGFGSTEFTPEQVKAACGNDEQGLTDWVDYQEALDQLADPETPERYATSARRTKERIERQLREAKKLMPEVQLPSSLTEALNNRQQHFAARFDPFRLAVEHEALKRTKLDDRAVRGGKKGYVSFVDLDPDMAPEKTAEKTHLEQRTRELLDNLGLADMGLIRDFDLCRFSFGYSRMSSTPVLEDKRGDNMPVRLNLFPPVEHDEKQKAPIYVVQQSNEALYVRLKPEAVLTWLETLDCPDMFKLATGEKMGAALLSRAWPMGPFLDGLPQNDQPPVYLYLYTLLHSYSHLLMRHVSEYSGLDLGSLGEYIFPVDLAFVVYRNGTTMDLGNLSAMWRNAGTAMLMAMLSSKSTQCGTGSLCTHRGGSCPDCTMMPETSCVASNKLLSRSVLRSIGGQPRFDVRQGGIRGYFDFTKPSVPAAALTQTTAGATPAVPEPT